jgi:hypothetical protein
MLNIVTENENLNFKGDHAPLIEGYIVEVLRREYLNIVHDIDIEPNEMTQTFYKNLEETIDNNKILRKSNSDSFSQNYKIPLNSSSNNFLCNSIKMDKSAKPQVLKIQQIASKSNTVITANSPSKPIIYMSSNPVNNLPIVASVTPNQSPIKNKLIKLNTQLNSLVTQNSNNHFIKTQTLNKESESISYINEINNIGTKININKDSNNIDSNGQSTQVLNLVLVADSVNGGVSYLSLIPSNNNNT